MAISLGTIYGDVRLRLGQLNQDANQVKQTLGGVADKIGFTSSNAVQTGKLAMIAFAGIATAVLGVGIATTHMAGDFQAGITTLVTGAGEAKSNIGLISNGVLKLANDTGTSTQQLISGLYEIESAGYHGAAGLSVLKASAEGAKVGNADLGVVSNALTTILTDYHLSGDKAVSTMNALTVTVASGKMHLQDLAGSMGSVLPLAASLGLSFPQVAGGLAVMTNAGMDAQRASMNLAFTIRSLAAPGAAAQKSLASIGISAQQLKDTLSKQGLTGAIQLVEDQVNKKFPAGSVQAVEAFKKIMGGAAGYNTALMLGGQNMSAYESNVKAISDAMHKGGSEVQGWSDVQSDFNFKMDRAKEVIETTGIKIGTALLPMAGKLVDLFSTQAVPALQKFTDFAQHNIPVIAAVFVGPLAMGAYTAAAALWAMVAPALIAAAPFIGIAAAVSLVAVGIVKLYNSSKPFRTMVQSIASVLKNELFVAMNNAKKAFADAQPQIKQLQGAFEKLEPVGEFLAKVVGGTIVIAIGVAIGAINGMIGAMKGIIEFTTGLITYIRGGWDIISGIFTLNGDKIGKGINELTSGIGMMFKGMFDTVTGFVKGFVGGIIGWFQQLYDKLVGHSIIPDLVNDIIGAFANLPAKLGSIGGDIMSGLTNGIIAGGKKALSTVMNVGSNMINGLKSLFQSHSPSAVMADFGNTGIMGGWAQGILAGSPQVMGAMQSVSSSLMNTAASTNLSGSMGSGGGSGTTVNVYLTVDVQTDETDDQGAQDAGTQFGTSVGYGLAAALQQRGY